MKITLISLYSDIQSIGIRTLSAIAKQHGHQTQMIFMWCPTNFGKGSFDFMTDADLDRLEDDLVDIVQDSDLIGIGLLSEHVFRARHLTQKLHERLSIPIIWGGIHPTIRPEECLEYADMICSGDAEYTFPELLAALDRGESKPEIAGIYYRGESLETASRKPHPTSQDLDSIPWPDYDSDSFILDALGDARLKPVTEDILFKYMQLEDYDLPAGSTFGIISSRGCPYNCTFCTVSYLREIHDGKYNVRARGVDDVVGELAWAKERFPFIKGVRFHDDTFVARTQESLEEFRDKYPSKVGLPFCVYAHPRDITRAKMEILCDAGMSRVGMGIQTGSRRLQKKYRRLTTNEMIGGAASLIEEFGRRGLMPPFYDMIIDSYNEEEVDSVETYKLLLDLPMPYSLHIFNMVLWPGTQVFNEAVANGQLVDVDEEVYRASYHVKDPSYISLVYACFRHSKYVPRVVLKFLSNPTVVHFMNSGRLKPAYPPVINFAKLAKNGFRKSQFTFSTSN